MNNDLLSAVSVLWVDKVLFGKEVKVIEVSVAIFWL